MRTDEIKACPLKKEISLVVLARGFFFCYAGKTAVKRSYSHFKREANQGDQMFSCHVIGICDRAPLGPPLPRFLWTFLREFLNRYADEGEAFYELHSNWWRDACLLFHSWVQTIITGVETFSFYKKKKIKVTQSAHQVMANMFRDRRGGV